MFVEFTLRSPGNHTTLTPTLHMTSVPRVGEMVTVDGESLHTVHSVAYDVSDPGKIVARVLLRE